MTEPKDFLDLHKAEEDAAAEMAEVLRLQKEQAATEREAAAKAEKKRERMAAFEVVIAKVNAFFDQLEAMSARGEFEELTRIFNDRSPELSREMDTFSDLWQEYHDAKERFNLRIDALNERERLAFSPQEKLEKVFAAVDAQIKESILNINTQLIRPEVLDQEIRVKINSQVRDLRARGQYDSKLAILTAEMVGYFREKMKLYEAAYKEALAKRLESVFAEVSRNLDAVTHDLETNPVTPVEVRNKIEELLENRIGVLRTQHNWNSALSHREEELLKVVKQKIDLYERKYADYLNSKRDVKVRLEEARERYVKAKRRLNDTKGIKETLYTFLSKKSVDHTEQEHHDAQAEYNRVRAEYVAADISRHLGEEREVLDKKLQELYPDKKGNVLYEQVNRVSNAVVEFYKFSGRVNLESKYKGDNRFVKGVLRGLNLRTAIQFGLMGSGVGLVAYGAGGLGLAALVSGRIMRGVTTGIGSYLALEGVRQHNIGKRIESELDKMTKEEVLKELQGVTARHMLAGFEIEKLAENADYQKLKSRYEHFLALETGTETNAAALQAIYRTRSEEMDKALDVALQKEKNATTARKLIAAGIGVAAGSGLIGRAMKGIWDVGSEGIQHAYNTPLKDLLRGYLSGQTVNNLTERGINGVLGGAKEAVAATDGIEHSGLAKDVNLPLEERPLESRPLKIPHWSPEGVNHPNPALNVEGFDVDAKGFEGDLLQNIKDGKLKLDWLEEHYSSKTPGGNTPEKLVHRFMLDVEKNNPGDWDRIFKGHYTIDKLTGEIKVGVDQTDFMPPKATVSPEVLEKPTGPAVENLTQSEQPLPRTELPNALTENQMRANLALETEASSPPAGTEPITEASQPATLEETREALAWQQEKTSTGLVFMLGDDYDRFMKRTIGLAARNLDKIKDLSYQEFLAKMEDEKFAKTYGKLAKMLTGVRNIETLRMHNVVLTLAEVSKNK